MAKTYKFDGEVLSLFIRIYHPDAGGGCHVVIKNKITEENLTGGKNQHSLRLDDNPKTPDMAVRDFIKIIELFEKEKSDTPPMVRDFKVEHLVNGEWEIPDPYPERENPVALMRDIYRRSGLYEHPLFDFEAAERNFEKLYLYSEQEIEGFVAERVLNE